MDLTNLAGSLRVAKRIPPEDPKALLAALKRSYAERFITSRMWDWWNSRPNKPDFLYAWPTWKSWKQGALDWDFKEPAIANHGWSVAVELATHSPQGWCKRVEKKSPNTFEDVKTWLETQVSRRGWYISSTIAGRHTWKVLIEPNYGQRVQVPQWLYHATSGDNIVSILKKGIQPRATTRYVNQPPRVYLATNLPRAKEIKSLLFLNESMVGVDAESEWAGHIPWAEPYVILKISTKRLLKGTKFYKDSDFERGVWTYSHIPAKALSRVV